jgi:Bacterial RNA polymerase, alpha chain C terminal domain
MILDILIVLFFVLSLLLIFWMVREHRRDVLHGNYVSKSEVVRATSKPIGVPDLQASAKPRGPLSSAVNDLSHIVCEVERDDVGATKDGLTHFSVASESRPAASRARDEGEREVSDKERSTDPGLSAAKRKPFRSRAAQEAISDHEHAKEAFRANLERLRAERPAREAAPGPMLYPAHELPDDTLVENVRFSTRVRNALKNGDLKTLGEIREASDATLLSMQNLGKASVAYLRQSLGLRSTGGGRPDKRA